MELVDIRLEVRERVGELAADFFTDAEVDRAINEAVRRFASEEKWPFLLTEFTAELEEDDDGSPVPEFNLPTDISLTRTFNLAISGGSLSRPRMITRVDAGEGFALRHQYTDRESAPRWYYIARTNVHDDQGESVTYTVKLVPFPDDFYDIEGLYYATPVLLSGAGDEPMIPAEYQEAIPAWAAGKLFLKEHMVSQKSSEQFQLYSNVLNQARKDLRSFSEDEIVAWGRREPLRGYFMQDPRGRILPTLG